VLGFFFADDVKTLMLMADVEQVKALDKGGSQQPATDELEPKPMKKIGHSRANQN
jgi:hypothetical protein